MAKVCKFCNCENDEEREFCEQCGAKLPVFHHLAADLEARKPKKHIKINFLMVFLVIGILFIGYCIFLVFYPNLPEDKLLNHNLAVRGAKGIASALEQSRSDQDFEAAVEVHPDALSLYLSSLAKPSLMDRKHFRSDVVPRLLVVFDKNNPKEFKFIHRGKFYNLDTRAEFIFRQHENENVWFIDSCRIGKFPMTWFSESMLSSVLEDYSRHPEMRKILCSKLDIKYRNSYVSIHLKYSKRDISGKIGQFFSNLFSKARSVVRKDGE